MYRHFCPGTPVVLVGMKSDLREGVQNSSRPINLVSRDNIEQVAKETGIDDTNSLLFKYYTLNFMCMACDAILCYRSQCLL